MAEAAAGQDRLAEVVAILAEVDRMVAAADQADNFKIE